MAPKNSTPKNPSSGRFSMLHEPTAVNFSFFSEEEIRKLSVKNITNPTAFDALNHPVLGGLYDPAMGPTDPSQGSCETCGLSASHCAGHLGHIELQLPVYNPIVFGNMFKLLQMKCLSCHRFRMRTDRVRVFKVKLLLLQANLIKEAEGLEGELLGRDGNESETPDEYSQRVDNVLLKHERSAVSTIHAIRAKALESSQDPSLTRREASKFRDNLHMQTHTRQAWKNIVNEFMKAVPKKACENCGGVAYKFRKDGAVKIFRMPLSKKDKQAQAKKGTSISPAFEYSSNKPTSEAANSDSDDDSSSSDDDDDDAMDVDASSGPQKKSGAKEEDKVATGTSTGTFLPVVEVEEQLSLLWENEKGLCSLIWGKSPAILASEAAANSLVTTEDGGVGYKAFFMRVIPVPPSRFRPPTVLGGLNFEHPQNVSLTKVLNLNQRLVTRFNADAKSRKGGSSITNASAATFEGALNDWLQLQETVNGFLDSSKAATQAGQEPPPGVRQLLEKKQGLFRQNMMGKRVNYAARSVISPDPYIGTDEVGVPVRFATKLTYPEPVTEINCKELAEMVRNGPDCHPGALFIEDDNGRLTDLRKRNARQRADLANNLENFHVHGLREERALQANKVDMGSVENIFKQEQNKQQAQLALRRETRVWRHLRSGDVMLANRQPTLHKPSIMAHKVRVIANKNMQTIRLHYANCNTYNADFDGDEINLHFPQNELARAEAFEIAYTNKQYCAPTNGEPLRGLIQDHVGMGLMLTKQNTFLKRDEYTQMVFAALDAMKVDHKNDLPFLPPAVLKPRQMWTGKQVVSTVLMHLAGTTEAQGLFCMGPSKSKIPAKAWNEYNPIRSEEELELLKTKKFRKVREKSLALVGGVDGPLGQTKMIIRQGEFLVGVIDKAQIGASKFGLVHTVHELYGPDAAGELLSAFGRLFTYCAQKWGHTCAIEDLILNPTAEQQRQDTIKQVAVAGVKVSADFAGVGKLIHGNKTNALLEREVSRQLHAHIRENGDATACDNMEAALDSAMQGVTSNATTEIIGYSLPAGQRKPFPSNCFSLMIFTGAKGSLVNHTQVSCALGQQALEGRRVPRMISGKSLPCFSAFDPTPRAGGYVSDRFLTGVRPQEYYFHCMAGREGLVDTAVKTSRSGYLQRCLVKHLECLSVAYDRTVRSSDGSVVQFLYGEDGLDPLETQFLSGSDNTLSFMYENVGPLCKRLRVGPGDGNLVILDEDSDEADKKNPTAVNGTEASRRYQQVKQSKLAAADGSDKFVKGLTVLVRRPRDLAGKFSKLGSLREHFHGTFERALVTKVRSSESPVQVDIQFQADGVKLKKFPVSLQVPVETHRGEGKGEERVVEMKTFPLVKPFVAEPVMWQLSPDQYLGSINEQLQEKLDKYISSNPQKLIQDSDDGETLSQLLWVKYLRSLAPPGENVGCLAAQSIGEPSTQMTLNTFHLAGHGAGNVTLGIPRLRELLMTASRAIKTPSMRLPVRVGVSEAQAESMRATMNKLDLVDLLQAKNGIVVNELLCRKSPGDGTCAEAERAVEMVRAGSLGGTWMRRYKIKLRLQSLKAIEEEFRVKLGQIGGAIGNQFLTRLLRQIATELRRSGETMYFSIGKDDEGGMDGNGMDAEVEDGAPKSKKKKKLPNQEEGDSSDDENDDAEKHDEEGADGDKALRQKREVDGYDDEDESSDDSIDDNNSVSSQSMSSDEDADPAAMPATTQKRVKGRQMAEVPVPGRIQGNACFVSCKSYTEDVNNDEEPNAYIECVIQFPASAKKLLMVGIAEAVAAKTVVKSIKGISGAYLVKNKKDDSMTISTDGCNFHAAWLRSNIVDVNRIDANDVGAILDIYGVEAARAAIVKEIKGVFGAYSIGVDPRHLGLVADYMTFEGGYRPLNRSGIEGNTSPFLRMTFETSANFLTSAAVFGEREPMESPSSRICMGQVIESGTGCFELMVPAGGATKK